jgi:outer membrane protein insertion porin family
MRRAASLWLMAWVAAGSLQAAEPFQIRDIQVKGLQRTDPGTVFAALPFRVGDTYTDDKASQALRALFATGLFKDVRLDIQGDVTVVTVEERPVVATVQFIGLKEFEKDTLLRSLKDTGIAEGAPFDRALVDRAEQEIKRQYLSRSLYGAEVVTTITPIERNRVNVTFTVSEGDAARIKDVRIVGAKAFTEDRLKSVMELSTGTWLTWYTKADRYSRSKLNADLEALRSFYVNRGYLEFAVESAQVTISPDKQDIGIAITIQEGQPYVVTSVRMEGQYLGKEEEFRRLVRVVPGQAYKADDVEATIKAFNERFATFGYAFARVDVRPDLDRKTGQVVLSLVAEPQRRVYVRRIEVAGNARTRDEVIRREMRQLEAAWYDGAKIKVSRDRIERLGYFKDVQVETREVPGSPDQVDLIVNVEERPTGSLSLGAGYSSAEKVTLALGFKQDNIFGTGNYLGVDINTSKVYRTVSISTVDPYFTADGISRSFDVYYRTTRPFNSLNSEFMVANPGAAIKFGVPFSDSDTVYLGVGYDRTDVRLTPLLPATYLAYRNEYGPSSFGIPLTVGWQRDERDSVLAPTNGRYLRGNFEWSVAGDVRYTKTNFQAQQYLPLTASNTLGLNAEIGWGSSQGGRTFPVFKNFFGGGLGTVRGFEQGSLGLTDSTGAYMGGPKRLNANAELYAPLPGSGKDKTLRVYAFTDIGNVWAATQTPSLSTLRMSGGVGLSWVSPVGPLRLSYGLPLKSEATDKIQRVQFQIGTAF